MEDTDKMTPGQVASQTFAYLRRIESQLQNVTEILLRHETRLGRIEVEVRRDIDDLRRDVREVKSDIVLLENQMLNRINGVFEVVRRLDDHNNRINSLETPVPVS